MGRKGIGDLLGLINDYSPLSAFTVFELKHTDRGGDGSVILPGLLFVYLCVAPEISLDHFRPALSARELLDRPGIDQVTEEYRG